MNERFQDLDPELDYRFGWRCLLPLHLGRRVNCLGFTTREKDFLYHVMDERSPEGETGALQGWIINADGIHVNAVLADILAPDSSWFAAVGTGRRLARLKNLAAAHYEIEEYALLPPNQSRVVVPLAPLGALRAGLHLHRPGRKTARWAIALSSLLARFGCTLPLRKKGLFIGIRDEAANGFSSHPATACSLEPRLKPKDFPIDPRRITRGKAALYLGNPEPGRKTVLLPLEKLPPQKIIKMGETPTARQALQNEKETLEVLTRTPLRNNVPAVLDWQENSAAALLTLEYRERSRISRRVMGEAVVDFLTLLASMDSRTLPMKRFLADDPRFRFIRRSEDALLQALAEWLERRSAAGTQVFLHRAHGDFAPWNYAWTGRGLFVFDWEESRAAETALADAFSYAVFPAVYVSGFHDPVKVLSEALALAGRVAAKAGLRPMDVPVHAVLWLCPRIHHHALYRTLLRMVLDRFP
ncbi:MAG: phosphotransferase [Desulfosoma sp.]